MKIVTVSGGFDPVHVGHLQMFQEAKNLGDKLIVILNNDNWLLKKKGYTFMSENDRKRILEELRCVDEVVLTKHLPNDEDTSVCSTLVEINPDIFANGGDRKKDNIPEYALCEKLGIDMKFAIGGDKIRSSSALVKNAKNTREKK